METSKRKQLDRFLDKIPLKILQTATRRVEGKSPGRNKKMRKCPHCTFRGGTREMKGHIAESHPRMGWGKPKGRKKKIRPCPVCGKRFGVAEMRVHRGKDHPLARKSKKEQ